MVCSTRALVGTTNTERSPVRSTMWPAMTVLPVRGGRTMRHRGTSLADGALVAGLVATSSR